MKDMELKNGTLEIVCQYGHSGHKGTREPGTCFRRNWRISYSAVHTHVYNDGSNFMVFHSDLQEHQEDQHLDLADISEYSGTGSARV